MYDPINWEAFETLDFVLWYLPEEINIE